MNALRLPSEALEAMLAHARNCAPEEGCGLVAMDPIGEIRFVYPLTNADASESSFTIEPSESYGAYMHADRSGWRIGGVFHSHPQGPVSMSAADVSGSVDPRWVHFLLTPSQVKCYRVVDGAVEEVHLAGTQSQ